MGHAVDNMSRHYVQVPQPPLIEAINKLPVLRAWRMKDSIAYSKKLVRLHRRLSQLDPTLCKIREVSKSKKDKSLISLP